MYWPLITPHMILADKKISLYKAVYIIIKNVNNNINNKSNDLRKIIKI